MILGIWDTLGEYAGYFYDMLDSGLGFIWEWPGIYAVFVVAIIVGIVSVSAQYVLVDQKRLREIREEQSDYQKKMLQAQKHLVRIIEEIGDDDNQSPPLYPLRQLMKGG